MRHISDADRSPHGDTRVGYPCGLHPPEAMTAIIRPWWDAQDGGVTIPLPSTGYPVSRRHPMASCLA